MSKNEKRRQKQLAHKRREQARQAKRSNKPKIASQPGGFETTAPMIALAADYPIHEALVPAGLFEKGIGNLFLTRALPDGRLALSAFLLDVFCLGVKNAFAAIVTREEYAQRLSRWTPEESLQPTEPACLRKLVEGAVAYARDLGFRPHEDYAMACQIFGDVDSSACPTSFEYGSEGKPCYVSGPNETLAQAKAIVNQLKRRLGEGNFDYFVTVG